MAVWFARQATNVNAVNVWNAASDGSGAWLTWPPASGDVLMANGYIVTVNVNANLGSLGQVRTDTANGAITGGRFTLSNGVSLTANAYAGSTACVFSNQSTGFLVGNVFGGSANAADGVYYGGTGTFTITGNIAGGTVSGGAGVRLATNGTVNVTGNLTMTVNNANAVVNATASGIVHVTGNVAGCTVSGAQAGTAYLVSTGTLNVTGNVTGSIGWGVHLFAASTLTVSGYAQSGTTGSAIFNNALGIVTVGETRSASNGRPAVAGAFRYASATAAKAMPYTVSEGQISMTVLDVAAIVPAESDVRETVVYGDGAYTGTLPLGRNRTSMAGRF